MIEELLLIGSAIGIKLTDIDPWAMTDPSLYGDHIPSLLQDLRLVRPLEIGGTILAARELARAKKISSPHLMTVAALLAAISPAELPMRK